MPRVTEVRFHDDLHLVRYLEGREGKLFVVSRPYRVTWYLDGEPMSWIVPKGTETDLASIPTIVPKWIAQKVGGHIEAAVIHDHLCIVKPIVIGYREAAEVFLGGMVACGVPVWRRELMYRAVLIGGPKW